MLANHPEEIVVHGNYSSMSAQTSQRSSVDSNYLPGLNRALSSPGLQAASALAAARLSASPGTIQTALDAAASAPGKSSRVALK